MPEDSSELLLREIHINIVSRVESWGKTNPTVVNAAVFTALIEVANSIDSVLVFRKLNREDQSC